MLRESFQAKPEPRRAAVEAWLLGASIAWCAILSCSLAYLVLVAVL